MGWTWFAAAATALTLLWRLAADFVPMFPLNDLARKSTKSRNRDWTVHYVPLGLALLLSFSANRLALGAALLIVILYVGVLLATYWVPYWKGGSETQKHRSEQIYGRTHRFLPAIGDHSIPNTAHVVSSLLAFLMMVAVGGHLLTAEGNSRAASAKTEESAEAKPAAAAVESAFTLAGQKPEQLLISSYQSAKSTLDIAISAINHDEIVKAILDARIRGVQVRIITDRTESANAAQAEKLKQLIEGGIPVKQNSRKGLMDLKVSIIDDQAVTTGSFNYTVNAATANDEVLLVLRDPATAKQWKQQFEAMWNDTQNYGDLKLGVVPKK